MNESFSLALEKLFFAVSRPITKKQRILSLLKRRGKHGASNVELKNICFSYVQRIHGLRRDGHKIRSQHVKGGLWRFYFEPEDA